MNGLAGSVRVAYPLFQEDGGGSIPTSAIQLHFRTCRFDEAKRLNRLWHSRLPVMGRPACIQSYSAEFDGLFYATAIWTNPVARSLPQYEWMELNRMAIAPDAPKNTATRFLGWMTREIRKTFPDVKRLVSYQDTEVHTGTIYKASGWLPTLLNDGGDWTRLRRSSRPSQSVVPKQRWEKPLREIEPLTPRPSHPII